jgi:molybdenum cofactor cytidylyltransferase
MKKIGVLVLAAGKSSRMNSIKQLEKIDGKTILDITLTKIKTLFDDNIYCVLGANATIIKQEITSKKTTFITNKNFEQGLSSSIVTGLQYFKNNQFIFEGVLILLADQPAIEISYLESMIDLFEEHPTKIIASNYGNMLGVPALFPSIYLNELLLIKGDKGAKEFINQKRGDVICPQESTNLVDLDTQEDLIQFIKSKEKTFKK